MAQEVCSNTSGKSGKVEWKGLEEDVGILELKCMT